MLILKDILKSISDSKLITMGPGMVFTFTEKNTGQRVNVFMDDNTTIGLYVDPASPTVRIIGKRKAYFVRESLAQVIGLVLVGLNKKEK